MMMEVTYLAKEAAELLWETVAMQAGDPSPSPEMTVTTADLADKAQMLNSQLRGLIRNDEGKSEVLLAEALEANDMLDSCLSEYNAGKSGGANGTQAEASGGQRRPTKAKRRPNKTNGRHTEAQRNRTEAKRRPNGASRSQTDANGTQTEANKRCYPAR